MKLRMVGAVCLMFFGVALIAPGEAAADSWHKQEWKRSYNHSYHSDWRANRYERMQERRERICERRASRGWRTPWFCDQGGSYEEPTYEPEVNDPKLDFWVYPNTIEPGEQAHIGWESSYTHTCTAYDDWGGSKSLDGKHYVYPTSDQHYKMVCEGEGGTITREVTLYVNDDDDEEEFEDDEDEKDEEEDDEQTITEIVVGDSRFDTLETAVIAAELADDLDDEDSEYTVFAPTDEAFENLPEGLLDALLLSPTSSLREVLLYHVVADELEAEDVVERVSILMANGDFAGIEVDGETVRINDSEIIVTDIEAENGIIHIIDAVLIPPGLE